MKQEITKKIIVVILFTFYFMTGVLLYKDYGISTDEPPERRSTFTNIKYVLDLMNIDKLDGADGDLENYTDRYYGVIMQVPPVLVEWAKGFPEGPCIYYIRHLWTFFVCFGGYICFYLMCRETFASRWISLLGTAMIALYPRFFAQQFYNIKDMLFTAMFMVSMFVTVKVIQNKYSIFWSLLFSVVTAVTTNVRIVGFIFPILLIGYLILVGLLSKYGIRDENQEVPIIQRIILIIAVFLLVYIASMPILWKHPLQQILAVLTEFSDYDNWHGVNVFMGKIISGQSIPWYYVPIWLLISLPVWYLLLGILAIGIFLFVIVRKLKTNHKITVSFLFQNKYILWAFLLAFLPWIATVAAHSTLYNGWRHCYFLLPPIIFLLMNGLNYIWKYLKTKKLIVGSILAVIFLGLLLQTSWIFKNHPYEMVYLNVASRRWGAYFDRDYWKLAHVDLCKYILEHDDSEQILIQTSGDVFLHLLSDEEKDRIILLDEEKEHIILEEEKPEYIIETYRGKIGNNNIVEGYEDFYSITIDGYRIATIFKRCL